jgi:RHS repeat-associated protein
LPNSNKLISVADEFSDPNTKLGDFHDGPSGFWSDDYEYDVNGNLTKDNNKAISSISYNHLNLPQIINITGKGSIEYVYDASGNKLKKIVHETGKADKTTAYLFGVYEDDVLQFLPHEEGRIRPQRDVSNNITGFVNDYFLKDHLGNVRMVLTEEVKTDPYEVLTFEDQNITQQNAQWEDKDGNAIGVIGVRASRPSGFGNSTNQGNYVRLVRSSGTSIGAAKLLKVMAGDRIHTKLDYYYNSANTTNSTSSPVGTMINSLINTLTGSPAASPILHGNESAISTQLSADSYLSAFVNPNPNTNPNNSAQQAPKAYLCVLFFNEQFQFDKDHSFIEKVQYLTNGNYGNIDRTFSNAIEAQKNGFAYIYFTNESDEMVYFDNFSLSHERGSILEETHYYPFGTKMAAISSKAAGSVVNKRQYNGKEKQNEEFSDGSGLDWYDFGARMYDNQIGRWMTVDPLAQKRDWLTPYNYVQNNPMVRIDPNGLTDLR